MKWNEQWTHYFSYFILTNPICNQIENESKRKKKWSEMNKTHIFNATGKITIILYNVQKSQRLLFWFAAVFLVLSASHQKIVCLNFFFFYNFKERERIDVQTKSNKVREKGRELTQNQFMLNGFP